jgi:hypothetical protein
MNTDKFQVPNLKSQTSSKFQAPNLKQAPILKHQIPNGAFEREKVLFGISDLELGICLRVGICGLMLD